MHTCIYYIFRCPSGVVASRNASPTVIASKLLGGVDQATLRQSLSSRDNLATPTDYLSDVEVCLFSGQIYDMEALQLEITSSDMQVLSVICTIQCAKLEQMH